jgi:excisionase family DNA binding protein
LMNESQLVTVDEATVILRLQPSTIRSWMHQGRIPFVKLGSRVFLRKEDCLQVIENNVIKKTRARKPGDDTG